MRVGGRGGSSGIGGGVASNCWQLLLLALIAQAALGGEMHAPHHVMFTPVEHVPAHLLGLLVTVLGRDLLPCLVLFLPGLVTPVFLVPPLLVVVEGVFEVLVGLKMPIEGIDLGNHGNNLLAVRRFGAPQPLLPEPIMLVSEIDELAVKVVVVKL